MSPGSASTGTTTFPSNNFVSVFGKTIAQVRAITNKPVLLSETAVGPVAGQAAKIANLFAGMHQYGTLGLVWFDIAQDDGLYHQDWRLENSPAAEAAFRLGASRMNLTVLDRPGIGAAIAAPGVMSVSSGTEPHEGRSDPAGVRSSAVAAPPAGIGTPRFGSSRSPCLAASSRSIPDWASNTMTRIRAATMPSIQ